MTRQWHPLPGYTTKILQPDKRAELIIRYSKTLRQEPVGQQDGGAHRQHHAWAAETTSEQPQYQR